jgi:uncharacterized membrane protein
MKNKKEIIIKISEIYKNYSNILLQWKIDPIAMVAMVIAMFTYQELWLGVKVYTIVILSIHMPVIFYQAYKKVSKRNKE